MRSEQDDVLACLLQGTSVDEAALAGVDVDRLTRRAEYHGIVPLVAHRLSGSTGAARALREGLKEPARRMLAADLVREPEIQAVLAELIRAGVVQLVMKGCQLAYSCYERPDLRPRLDTDLLIPASARDRAAAVLADLGYVAAGQVDGHLLNYQVTYIKWRDGLKQHVVDVHWRVANPQVFAGLMSYDELMREAVDIPALGRGVKGLPPAAALLLACVHRVAHHFDSDRLIWLYDIHLLASGMTTSDWDRFLDLAWQRKVAAVCTRSLDLTARYLGTAVPASVWNDRRLQAAGEPEASAGFLGAGRRQVDIMADDLQALPRWRDRVQLIRQHLFPSRQYMREVYALSPRTPLPLLYATRVVRGARRWFERSPINDDASGLR